MTKKWVRFLVAVTLNIVTLPYVPVKTVVMTILMICQDIRYHEHLIDIIRNVIDLWRVILLSVKAAIENSRDYVKYGSCRDIDETVNDVLDIVLIEEEP